jgi:hypothetical protein
MQEFDAEDLELNAPSSRKFKLKKCCWITCTPVGTTIESITALIAPLIGTSYIVLVILLTFILDNIYILIYMFVVPALVILGILLIAIGCAVTYEFICRILSCVEHIRMRIRYQEIKETKIQIPEP